jgi:hypothetical protein
VDTRLVSGFWFVIKQMLSSVGGFDGAVLAGRRLSGESDMLSVALAVTCDGGFGDERCRLHQASVDASPSIDFTGHRPSHTTSPMHALPRPPLNHAAVWAPLLPRAERQ